MRKTNNVKSIQETIEQNYKHSLTLRIALEDGNGLIFFDCSKCNNLFWFEQEELYVWDKKSRWIITNLTCEEFIIKGIIE